MKKIGLLFIATLAVFTFSACNDEADYASYAEFATVKVLPGNDYYFEIDGQQQVKTMYPSDRSRIVGYTAEDGQRVIVYFNLLAEKLPNYDYNAAVYVVDDIYTGTSKIVSTQEELDALEDDPLTLGAVQCSRNFLMLRANYPMSNNDSHRFALIRNELTPPEQTREGYYNVEIRHDAGGELQGAVYQKYLSFDLTALRAALDEKDQAGNRKVKGLLIRVNTPNSEESEYFLADLPAEK